MTLETVVTVHRDATLDNLTHEDLAADVSGALAAAGADRSHSAPPIEVTVREAASVLDELDTMYAEPCAPAEAAGLFGRLRSGQPPVRRGNGHTKALVQRHPQHRSRAGRAVLWTRRSMAMNGRPSCSPIS